jgi:hypothetical protein
MKILPTGLAVAFSLAVLAGCNTGDTARRDDGDHRSAGEVAGKAAYEIKKGAQKAAKELKKDIQNFNHDAKEGYREQKAKDAARRRDPDPEKP